MASLSIVASQDCPALIEPGPSFSENARDVYTCEATQEGFAGYCGYALSKYGGGANLCCKGKFIRSATSSFNYDLGDSNPWIIKC
jgi:hypothetical protein